MVGGDQALFLGGAFAPGLDFGDCVGEIPKAVAVMRGRGVAGRIEVHQGDFFGRLQDRQRSVRIDQEAQVRVLLSVDERAEGAGLLVVVKLGENFGVVVGDVLIVEEPFELGQRMGHGSRDRQAQFRAAIENGLLHAARLENGVYAFQRLLLFLGGLICLDGVLLDFVGGGVGEVDDQGGEVLADFIGAHHSMKVLSGEVEGGFEMEVALADKRGDGEAAHHGGFEAERSGPEGERARVAGQGEVLNLPDLAEFAVAKGDVVGVGIGERRAAA